MRVRDITAVVMVPMVIMSMKELLPAAYTIPMTMPKIIGVSTTLNTVPMMPRTCRDFLQPTVEEGEWRVVEDLHLEPVDRYSSHFLYEGLQLVLLSV